MHGVICLVNSVNELVTPFSNGDLSRRSLSPAITGPPGPSMADMDGPLCRKWSPCSKPEKQWLQLQIDLYILTGELEVTIKIFRNNAMHVCCNSESSLAAKTTFSSYSFANCDLIIIIIIIIITSTSDLQPSTTGIILNSNLV